MCRKSDVHCIEEFKGDGICDDIHIGICEYDLQDCCLPNRLLDGTLDNCCHCACLPVMPVMFNNAE